VKLRWESESTRDYCVHQETIIKGDAKEKVIGLASILAKVTRDEYMRRRAKLAAFASYHFARHKGYGTVRSSAGDSRARICRLNTECQLLQKYRKVWYSDKTSPQNGLM
jgi:ribonuclease HII